MKNNNELSQRTVNATTEEDLRFLDCKMDTSLVKGRHAKIHFWFAKDRICEKLTFDRMSDHNPLLLTVSVK